MELKVWVEGVARVVSGLSVTTSCQDVVIALAQSIGQTGRYVLILKVRGTEKHLVPEDCPLQMLSQLGQNAADMHFVLQRNGPSIKRFPPPASPLRQRQQQKSLSFSLGPRSSSRASPVVSSSKEELFRHVLQQQKKLKDLEMELQSLERETELWSSGGSPPIMDLEMELWSSGGSAPIMDLTQELDHVEVQLRENHGELIYNQHLDQELQDELQREQEMKRRLNQIHSSIDDQTHEIQEIQTRSSNLEQQIEALIQSPEGPHTEPALEPLKQELVHRLQLAERLDTTLRDAQTELHSAQERVKYRSETIEELNKELRQCKLQQFIQQTGIPPQGDATNSLYLSNAGIKE